MSTYEKPNIIDSIDDRELKIYFACPTGKRRDEIVRKYGSTFGACLTRDLFNNTTASKMDWFLDNGAFKDWKEGKERTLYNIYKSNEKFLQRLEKIREKVKEGIIKAPDFVVTPDVVSKGVDSLMVSRNWLNIYKEEFPDFKYYLAAQDDMRFYHKQDGSSSPYCIEVGIKMSYDGLFIGGTKQWKYKHAEELVALSHKYGKRSHLGAIGTRKSILWSKSIKADSVDSGIAMIHPIHLKEVLEIHNDVFWNL